MAKYYFSKRVIFRVENDVVYREYFSTKNMNHWEFDGREFQNLTSIGGLDFVKANAVEIDDINEVIASLNEQKKAIRERANAMRESQRLKEAECATNKYREVFCNDVTECTLVNISILLRYLNTINWGVWRLPKMTIGYTCNQYDCGGRTATTIKLAKPIEGISRFVYGNPVGYLMNYVKIG